jgi:hypothetical protein
VLHAQDKAALKAEKEAKKAAKAERVCGAGTGLVAGRSLYFLLVCSPTLCPTCTQAQQRGVKQAAPTQPDADDPCASQWGDYALVQSQEITGRKWTKVEQLTPELSGQEVRPQLMLQEAAAGCSNISTRSSSPAQSGRQPVPCSRA